MSYFAEFKQNALVSTLNSSDANILAGATWTGSAEDTLGVAGIQVNIKSDQNISVSIEQSMNGVDFYIVDTFRYYYTIGGDSWTTQATAAYYRVQATNLNPAVATTVFHLQSILCPIVEAVPRALDENTHALKVCVEQVDGQFGYPSFISPMGATKTASIVRLVGSSFSDGVFDLNFWTTGTPVGSATVTQTAGEITLATGGTANSSITVNSLRVARYTIGIPNYVRTIVTLPATTGANIRRWGAFDSSSGYFFSYDGTTLRVGSRKAPAADVVVASGAFNGAQGATYTVSSVATLYEIYYTNRAAYFMVNGVLLHTLSADAATLVNTIHLKVGIEMTNTGGNTNNNTLLCRSASIGRMGEMLTQPTSARISTLTTVTLKYGPGNLHSILFGKLGANSNTITLYDGLGGAGTILWSALMNKNAQASDIPVSVDFKGLPFSTGLSVVTATGTASDLTVVYE